MYWPLTVLGAVAGFAVASIPGALLGGLLGQLADRRLGLDSWDALVALVTGRRLPARDELLFVLLGRLAKSEGRVLEVHIRQARSEMQRLNLDEAERRRAIDAFNRGKQDEVSPRTPLRRLRGDVAQAQALLRSCWRMAAVDGQIGMRERALILQWGAWLGREAAEVEALGAEFQPKKVPSPVAAGTPYKAALRLLGVAADSEPATIKQAYRRLLSQSHPDKLAGSGASPARVREATERTRELHAAYDLIRARRGFR
ncbi:TerB family tellurite resistance protein [Pseudomonas mangiferae]|uniref:Molecular chaperone DjlA n=1 Tax=Pseudomonas mangiferae TaxID=2593654 RepID=A0A553H039_9PSED|nr:TerB family tellurite resistance protein [Pseudomonas mangiferae]TRX75073.1 molecular chaperone DjlA [Pseudomonas mangiferae]